MNHSFNVEIAKKYGVDEAIILENIYFWIAKNKANQKHFYDGYYWTYNSIKAFCELFPYWTSRQLERILKSLENKKLLITGNYNKSSYDRTKWYSLSEEVCSLYQNGVHPIDQNEKSISPNVEMDFSKNVNGFPRKVEPIPDINTDIKPSINTNIINNAFLFDSEPSELEKTLIDFKNMRKSIKKPLTDTGFNLIIKKLNTMATNDSDKIKILEQSIMNSWQGLVPIKEQYDNKKTGGFTREKKEQNQYANGDYDIDELSRRYEVGGIYAKDKK